LGLVDLIHEPRPLALQRFHDVLVVNDLVADVDRRTKALQRTLHDPDRPLHARAEPPRLGEHDTQCGRIHGSSLPAILAVRDLQTVHFKQKPEQRKTNSQFH
jgi:hypothetical protein